MSWTPQVRWKARLLGAPSDGGRPSAVRHTISSHRGKGWTGRRQKRPRREAGGGGGGGEVNTGLLSMLSGQARMTPRSHTLPPGSRAKKTPLEGPRPLNKPSVINSINSEG